MIQIKNFFRNPRQFDFSAYQQLCQKNICRVPPLRTSWWWPHRNDSQNSLLIHEVCKYYWPSLCHYHDQSFNMIVFAWKYLGAWNTKWSVITLLPFNTFYFFLTIGRIIFFVWSPYWMINSHQYHWFEWSSCLHLETSLAPRTGLDSTWWSPHCWDTASCCPCSKYPTHSSPTSLRTLGSSFVPQRGVRPWPRTATAVLLRLRASRTVFMFSIHTASTGPSSVSSLHSLLAQHAYNKMWAVWLGWSSG